MYTKYVELRNKFGYTDYKVSQETGISRTTLSDWQHGRSKPKVDKLIVLAKFFNVDVSVFLENLA